MNLGLKDKVVLCMASAAGLGKGIAMEAAREGAKVMICTSEAFKDQLYAAQEEIAKETGNRPEAYFCDVNSPEDIEKLVSHTVETLGDIWALVNMCPGPQPGPFDSFDDSQWEKAFEMCLLSYVRTIRACLPSMRRLGGGRIVKFHQLLGKGLSGQSDSLQHHAYGRGGNVQDPCLRAGKG